MKQWSNVRNELTTLYLRKRGKKKKKKNGITSSDSSKCSVCVRGTSQGQWVDFGFLCVLTLPPSLFISVSRCSRMQGVLPVCGLQPLLALLLLQTACCGESSLNWRQSPSPDLQCAVHNSKCFRQTILQSVSNIWECLMCKYESQQ